MFAVGDHRTFEEFGYVFPYFIEWGGRKETIDNPDRLFHLFFREPDGAAVKLTVTLVYTHRKGISRNFFYIGGLKRHKYKTIPDILSYLRVKIFKKSCTLTA